MLSRPKTTLPRIIHDNTQGRDVYKQAGWQPILPKVKVSSPQISYTGPHQLAAMFFKVSSLIALALAGSALATPLARSEDLKVELSGAESVTSIDDVKITAAVTNTGSEAVKVLRYGTVLDSQLPTRSFHVAKDDADVAFTGIKVSGVSRDLHSMLI